MKSNWRILVVDDERNVREAMTAWLAADGYAVDSASSGPEAVTLAEQNAYAICFLDLKMPGGMDGLQALAELRRLRPAISVVIVTAFATVDTAVAAMKAGAVDYIVKPCNLHQISMLAERLLRFRRLERVNELLKQKLERRWRFHDIVSKNPRMAEVFALVRDVADTRTTVLVQGESGTGKEMIARALHNEGRRRDRPFVGVPCAALSETLLESELFGYERGAFTGAATQRKGKVELAHGGTLFLDEIGDVTPRLQADLLRFLQQRSFYRVGGTDEVAVDVRVVAATHHDLHREVQEGRFRHDLLYRLHVVTVRLPPLRERREDIPLLVEHFVERIGTEIGREVTGVSAGAMRVLMAFDWPGNVRVLENAVERALVTTHVSELTERDFAFLQQEAVTPSDWAPPPGLTLVEIDRRAIVATLDRTAWNVKRTAESLGTERSTLYERLKRYGLQRDETA